MTKTLCLLALLAGCYDNPPPRVPHVDAPAIVPGATLDVESSVTAERRRVTDHEAVCVGGHCDTVSVTSHQVVDIHHASATYNGIPLTYGQALALADPTFLKDQDEMARLTKSCERAAVPKLVGEVLFLAGDLGVIQGAATSDGSINEPWFALGVGAIVGGIASYALGKYVFGGQDCAPAKEIFDRRSGEFSSADAKDVEGSDADEIESVAKDFNARLRATATSN